MDLAGYGNLFGFVDWNLLDSDRAASIIHWILKLANLDGHYTLQYLCDWYRPRLAALVKEGMGLGVWRDQRLEKRAGKRNVISELEKYARE